MLFRRASAFKGVITAEIITSNEMIREPLFMGCDKVVRENPTETWRKWWNHKRFHHRRDKSGYHGSTNQRHYRFGNVLGSVSLEAVV
jgi:hypothetical protein